MTRRPPPPTTDTHDKLTRTERLLAARTERAPLTDRSVKAALPDTVEGRLITHVDELVPGLELRISYGGTKSWALRYIIGGRRKPFG